MNSESIQNIQIYKVYIESIENEQKYRTINDFISLSKLKAGIFILTAKDELQPDNNPAIGLIPDT